ncbi:hypothetical protein SAMN04488511_102230 [Pedobacter suwonensis]|uniref:DUF3945 domain-containing protein n=1 Tax=Pedobacter suwonensis TaxID=332999 RepID=A0A1I0SNF9_9SPHI|nr:hypothetical protein [Pedobacter suwonensis]SFA41055.1 hypothetical protein SAMN04488511_102230 [Pedobacter suwonensis]
MNENNLEYLQNNLKYLGFGESLNQQLKESIDKALPQFTLRLDITMPAVNAKDKPELADKIQYQLDFSKSKETDLYFFNKYQAFLEPAGKPYDTVDQIFFINKGKGVTAKESYNLLSGRAVNKDVVLKNGEKANMWLKLDLSERDPEKGYTVKNYGENYGFSLASSVDKFVLPDIDKPGFRDQLMKSLERGNLHEVSFSKDGKGMKGFVAANPQFKTLDFYDHNLRSVYSKAVDLKEVSAKVLAPDDKKEAVVEQATVEKKTGRGR